jgi:hypothetical protein
MMGMIEENLLMRKELNIMLILSVEVILKRRYKKKEPLLCPKNTSFPTPNLII